MNVCRRWICSGKSDWGIIRSASIWRFFGARDAGPACGRDVPGLSPETLMLFLCVHGAKHLWSRLQWLGDVARLARKQPDWACIWELANEAGCARPVLLGLLLAHELLEAPVPEEILERGRQAQVLQRLGSQVVWD